MCGDYEIKYTKNQITLGSPLHVRGLPTLILVRKSVTGITPACAGTTWTSQSSKVIGRDHPCMCGDYCKLRNKKDEE